MSWLACGACMISRARVAEFFGTCMKMRLWRSLPSRWESVIPVGGRTIYFTLVRALSKTDSSISGKCLEYRGRGTESAVVQRLLGAKGLEIAPLLFIEEDMISFIVQQFQDAIREFQLPVSGGSLRRGGTSSGKDKRGSTSLRCDFRDDVCDFVEGGHCCHFL